MNRVHMEVRRHYAKAALSARGAKASCCEMELWGHDANAATTARGAKASCCEPAFGASLYEGEVPESAANASLGCGNPTAVAELAAGETVLDLGSGGGLDVILSARRVGPSGKAYGLDMTPEMLELARDNAREAGVENVEFLRGTIESIPLPDASIDVLISNCVINLSPAKSEVFTEIHRVLRPGGRVAASDIVAEDHLSEAERAARGGWAECVAGALSVAEYKEGLGAVGFTDIELQFTHEVADGLHSAIVRAKR